MLTLFSYPGLFGVADNNPFGLKVYAFLKLSNIPFRHEQIFDASTAPRGQLPYLIDDDKVVGDSDTIIDYIITQKRLDADAALTPNQLDLQLLVGRMLDDLYWVMSYSRWKDDRFWPLFRDAMLRAHTNLKLGDMDGAREYNFKRYQFQGIGRFEPEAAYARGVKDLQVLANLVPESGFAFGSHPNSIDAAIYGFIANIYFFDIDTPLKAFVERNFNLVRHCEDVHQIVGG